MSTTTSTTTLIPPLQDDGGRPSSSPPPSRPASPKLGNFGAIFDLCFGPSAADQTAIPSSVDPVKSLQLPERPLSTLSNLSSSLASIGPSSVPRGSSYGVGFLSGLDLSTIESPSGTPLSLLLDTISEDDDSGQDEDAKEEGGADHGANDTTASKAALFLPSRDVVIASATSSPSASIAAATAKAVAVVLTATPARSSVTGRSPKRASGFASAPDFSPAPLRYDLPYPLGSVLVPTLAPPVLLPGSYPANHPVQPLSWNTRQEKLDMLEAKLKPEYKRDRALKVSTGAASSSSDASSIHVFVDLSNIVIGFYSRIRADRSIPQEKKMRAPPFFYEGFSRILERGRTAARRVTAGSAPDSNNRLSWPVYMREADALGYEMNILSRVSKSMPSPKLRPSSNKHSGYQGHRKNASSRGGNNDGQFYSDVYSSDDAFGPSSPVPPSTFKIGEQAVDEILQLKMCHSFLDHDPGTIVLATGDAAEAEFSDGFLKHVERALGRGWCVELLSWKMGISNAWRELERKQKGTGRFRIIELDKYSEDLLAVFVE